MSVSRKEIRRVYGGLRVKDAVKDVEIFVKQDHVDRAAPKEPDRCTLALAGIEYLNATKVLVWRTVMYIDHPDRETGKRFVHRYLVEGRAKDIVFATDKDKAKLKGDTWVTLKAPRPSQTLDSQDRRSKKSREERRQAKMRGEIYAPKRSMLYSEPKSEEVEVRDGRGMVQMIRVRARK